MASKMKDSGVEWIGEIPEGWTSVPLWSIASIGGKVQEYKESFPYLALENIESWTGRVYNLGSQENVESNVTLFDSNCVLFGKLRPYLAKVVRPSFEGMATTELLCFIPGSKSSKDYLFWCFANRAFIDSINAQTYGVKMPRTSWSQMRSMYMPLPPKEEQKAIASYVDETCSRIDAAISTIEKEIDVLERYKASLIHETVTKGLDPDAPMKDSGVEWIGEIPEGWTVRKTKHVAYTGSGTTPDSTDYSFYDNGFIPWIQSGDLYKRNEIHSTEKMVNDKALKTFSALHVYQTPFVVVAMYGASVGNTAISRIDACSNQACCCLSPLNIVLAEYLSYALQCAKQDLIRRAQGGTQPNISQEILKSEKIPLPPIADQKKIVGFLGDKLYSLNSVLKKKFEQLDLLRRQRQSLIYEYVTGKKRVPGYGEEA